MLSSYLAADCAVINGSTIFQAVLTPLALSLAGSLGSAEAQVRTVPDRVSCGGCTVEVAFRFRFAEPPGGLGALPLQVATWSDGQRVVRLSGRPPALYRSDGRFIREVGRRGAGPGEFEVAAHFSRLPGDSALILDSDLLRLSVLGPDMRFVRSVALPFYATALAPTDWPRVVTVNGMSYSADQAGWPLHAMDVSSSPARRLASFGDNDGQLFAGRDFALVRKFFAVTTTGYWTMHVTRYQLTRYSAAGRVEASIFRRPEWFSKDSPWSLGGPTDPPPPILQAAAVVRDTLWVAVGIPRVDWRKAWPAIPFGARRELTAAEAPEISELYRSRIEVIDLASGALIAQRDLDGVVIDIDESLAATVYDLDGASVPRLQLFDLRLRR